MPVSRRGETYVHTKQDLPKQMLVSRLEYIVRTVLRPLLFVVVKIYDVISTKTCFIWKEH
jgi:hypothetical protein